MTTITAITVAALVLLLVIAGALVGLAWRASGQAIHPASAVVASGLDDHPNLSAEDVEVTSSTGAVLAGRFFRGSTKATIVLSHGYGGNQDELLPTTSALHDAGFSVFTYDLRGCGRSTGAVTFGAREQDDLRSVIDYLTTRLDVDADRIGALGFSMGASTTIMAAARDPRIKAVVDDSGWSDVYHWLKPSIRAVFIRPGDRFSALSLKFAEVRADITLDHLKPKEDIARIAPRPLLIIHGTADESVPPGDSEENFASAGEPKELWTIEGARHGATIAPGGPNSSGRVIEFFRRALSANPNKDST